MAGLDINFFPLTRAGVKMPSDGKVQVLKSDTLAGTREAVLSQVQGCA
jgi:hypothetical protein